MNAKIFLPFAIMMGILTASLFPFTANATSWVYYFVVWDDHIYVISDETVTNIDKRIGKVTAYSDMESYGGNFSNVYPKGTKYYSIKDVDPKVAIAVQDENGQYIKATREGEYTYKEDFTKYIFRGLGIFAIIIVGLILFSKTRRN